MSFKIYELASIARDGFLNEQNSDMADEYADTCRELEELVLRNLQDLHYAR